ncbi:MAG: hypothetical protein EA390_10485 [Balneolaceae bacterium]|nr:MAG: hypothetical protein EA390_10485 [Balneolaceae bacterium]
MINFNRPKSIVISLIFLSSILIVMNLSGKSQLIQIDHGYSGVEAVALTFIDVYSNNSSTDYRTVLYPVNKNWQPLGGGMNRGVNAFAVFEETLYVSGGFTTAGNGEANRVARWDGTEWHALGSGMNEIVFDITIHNNELYAGGNFFEADGKTVNGVARWDGSEWQPLGSGMNNTVHALFSHGGNLYAGGNFTEAGDKTVNHVARWDGTEWHALGSGMGSQSRHAPTIQVFAIFDGNLVAGGSFHTADGKEAEFIATWDGEEWHPFEAGIFAIEYGSIYDLIIYEGSLVAAGRFNFEGGETNSIARWNGSEWQAMGDGIGASALEIYNGDLFAAGRFINSDGELKNRVVKWSGTEWHIVGTVDSELGFNALKSFGGNLIAGGMVTSIDGQSVNHVARWNPF